MGCLLLGNAEGAGYEVGGRGESWALCVQALVCAT
jgi:hypothetical protein